MGLLKKNISGASEIENNRANFRNRRANGNQGFMSSARIPVPSPRNRQKATLHNGDALKPNGTQKGLVNISLQIPKGEKFGVAAPKRKSIKKIAERRSSVIGSMSNLDLPNAP